MRHGHRLDGHDDPPASADHAGRRAGGVDPADQRLSTRAGEIPDGGRWEPAGRWRVAAERPEWQGLLARGEVERVGPGVVDERASRFQPPERRLADYLAGEGRAVAAIHDGFGRAGRRPDAAVDGVETEFKSLDPGASNTTVKAALTSAKGQADHAVVDARGAGLERQEAERGLRRFLGTPHATSMTAIRIIGDDFDLDWKRG